MAIELKTPKEIQLMRKAGVVAHRILQMMKEAVVPGATTEGLLNICIDELARAAPSG